MNARMFRPSPSTEATLASESHPIVVVCGADDRFAMPLAVTLYSALSNYRGSLPIKVFIVDGGIRGAHHLRIDRVLGSSARPLSGSSPTGDQCIILRSATAILRAYTFDC